MNENLSAWIDGELKGKPARRILSAWESDADCRHNWACYHLIGDTLRGLRGPDLSARICTRLDAEPTVQTPQRFFWAEKVSRFASMAASRTALVVFGASVSWVAFNSLKPNASTPPIEANQVPMAIGKDVRNYLLAHQQYSSSKALQDVSEFERLTMPVISPSTNR